MPGAFGEELVELVEVAVDEGLLEANGEERSLRLVTGLAQGFVRGQVAESAVDEAGGHGHPEGRLLFERGAVGGEGFAGQPGERQRVADCHRREREVEVVRTVLQVQLALRGGDVGRALHARAGDLRQFVAGFVEVHDALRLGDLLGRGAVRLHLRGRHVKADFAGGDRFAGVPGADYGAGHHAAHVAEDHVASLRDLELRIEAVVVGVALGAVDEHALDAVNRALDRLAHHARPVGADLVAADRVGVALEVDDRDRVASFAVDAHELDHLVGSADGPDHVGVVPSRVGAACAVLHAVAADECDVLGLAAREGELRRREVGERELHRVREALAQEALVGAGLVEGAEGLSVDARADDGSGVRVRAGDEDGLGRQAGGLGGLLAVEVVVGA